jgi:hypothetical protein
MRREPESDAETPIVRETVVVTQVAGEPRKRSAHGLPHGLETKMEVSLTPIQVLPP